MTYDEVFCRLSALGTLVASFEESFGARLEASLETLPVAKAKPELP